MQEKLIILNNLQFYTMMMVYIFEYKLIKIFNNFKYYEYKYTPVSYIYFSKVHNYIIRIIVL